MAGTTIPNKTAEKCAQNSSLTIFCSFWVYENVHYWQYFRIFSYFFAENQNFSSKIHLTIIIVYFLKDMYLYNPLKISGQNRPPPSYWNYQFVSKNLNVQKFYDFQPPFSWETDKVFQKIFSPSWSPWVDLSEKYYFYIPQISSWEDI